MDSETVRLHYTRMTARYWVYEMPPDASKARIMGSIYLRIGPGEKPDFVDVVATPGRLQPQVQGGRFVEEDV